MQQKIRKHGLGCPLHFFQVVLWLYLILTIVIFYLFLYPFIVDITFQALTIAFSCSIALVAIFGAITTLIDPMDSLVKAAWERKPL